MNLRDPLFLVIDLFCGGGGTSTGFHQAKIMGTDIAKVIACVNHDEKAIESHWKNYPDVKHFNEDYRNIDLQELLNVVEFQRRLFPNAKLILWASLPCPHFSRALGGSPKDEEIRTLAYSLYMKYNFKTKKHYKGDSYIQILKPDYIKIENVVEFMSWGPLDSEGKPMNKKNGNDFVRFCNDIIRIGYQQEWRELNSADFGAYTSRNRLFGIFAKPGMPIVWPKPTHSKKPGRGMFEGLKKWMPVKEVLDFADEGESILTRKKPLSDKTLERILAGLVKYVAKGDKAFISKYFSGRPAGKVNSVEDPASTVTTFGGQTLVQVSDLSVDQPAGTITTKDHHALVQTSFLSAHYSKGDNVSPVLNPCPTISTKDRFQLVQPQYFIDKHFHKAQNQSIDQPAGTIMPCDKHRLVEAVSFIMPTNFDNKPTSIEDPSPVITANRKHHYLVNPSHGGHSTSTEHPCPVIIARQDKAPLYLVQVENGPVAIAVFECDSQVMIRIKQFMANYGLVDIKMRMLRVHELLKIQGFPDHYVLVGNQSDQKKFIGNSVVPLVVKVWAEALAEKLIENDKIKAA